MLYILNRQKIRLLIILLISLLLFGFTHDTNKTEIIGPEIKYHNNEIIVKTTLSLEEKYIQEIKNGIKKEFIFYIDIYRVWNIWPDEFITGKTITRTLKYDLIKNDFLASSNDGNTIIKKRFKSLESMLDWALSIEDLKLAELNELDKGTYYVRVTVESKIRKLPPVIGYFMVFISETEFKLKKNSNNFFIGHSK